jgi:predicted dehydrogenase
MYIANNARKQKGVEMIAACDVDANRLAKAVETFGKECKGYKDFRDLLARDDIDAVTIGTPDHWHVLVALEALRRKKDIYCEKPLTLTIAEGKALVKAARESGRIFQVGTQQRSEGPQWRLACELVRNGRVGPLRRIETLIGANPRGGPFQTSEPPKELNWNFWQGQTPDVPYIKERCHYQFRWWYEYSGGKMTDWGAHHNDIAQWALGTDDSGPVAVEAIGEPPPTDGKSYNCHANFMVLYTYKLPKQPEHWHKDGVQLVCSSLENGVRFTGGDDKAHLAKTLFVSRNGAEFKASDPKIIEEPLPKDAIRLYESGNHMANFIDCVRTRKPTICPAEVGHRSVSVCHIGVIALRSGKRLKWDPVNEEFVGDEEANKWLSREMRKPWSLEA